MLFRRERERRSGHKPAKTMACPVCKGESVVRMTLTEASTWNDRVAAKNDAAADSVKRPCWACNGAGQMPVERRRVEIGHFER